MQNDLFCIWLLPTQIMVVVGFFFQIQSCRLLEAPVVHSFLWLTIPLSDYTTIYLFVLLFPVWTIMKKKAVMNLLEQVFLWPCVLISLNPRVKLLGHRIGACLTLLDIVLGLSKELLYPWLVWLSGLSARLQTERLPVQFPGRAQAWVASQVLSRGRERGIPIAVSLSHYVSLLFFHPPFPSL